MDLVRQKFFKGDFVRIKRTGEEVEVLAATLTRVKVKVACTWMDGWLSEMYSNDDVVKVDVDSW